VKISYQWLRDYLQLDKTPDQLEEALTLIGFEVEGIKQLGLPDLPNVVVGEILSREQHPNADRLGVCQVRVDRDGEPRQIVCGATNYKVGDRVPVALPGAVLPGDFKIKSSKLRGVQSDGMMCSPRELGLGDDHAGLMILSQRPELGTPINEVYPDSDIIFDIEVTPNRPDCLSHVGIARELAAYFDLELAYPEVRVSLPETSEHLIAGVDVLVPETCPHYLLYSIKGVKIAESPEWLKKRLETIGLRPINNVVDVTNYVLHELGQPMHAFDADKISGGKLVIRNAKQGEKIVTLDEKERALQPYMCVIADAEKPLVIAGVMGSVDAEVDNNTKDIVLEVAWFQPSAIRQTSRRLGLSSDSSYRFERGVDPKGAEYAAERAIELILQTAGGELLGGVHRIGCPPVTENEIEISPAYINSVLGFSIQDAEIQGILERLELEVNEHHREEIGKYWVVSIPSYRSDLQRPVDLVEEVLRIYGTTKIPQADVLAPGLINPDDAVYLFLRSSAEYLKGQYFQECVNYTLRSEEELGRLFAYSYANSLKLSNPLAQDQTHLRPSLLLGLLDNIRYNLDRGNTSLRLFETGKCFKEVNGRVYEMASVAFVVYLPDQQTNWYKEQQPDYYAARGWIEDMLRMAGVDPSSAVLEAMPSGRPWSEGHSAILGDFSHGWAAKFGYLGVPVLKQWDIPGRLLAGTIHVIPESVKRVSAFPRYQPLSSYPSVSRDISLVVPQNVWSSEVESFLRKAVTAVLPSEVKLEGITLFDVFQGKGIEDGMKSLTYSLTFRSTERTLTNDEIGAVFTALLQAVQQHSQYTLRS
jgi:phenylalanyl-tRNA synthetase beta chain